MRTYNLLPLFIVLACGAQEQAMGDAAMTDGANDSSGASEGDEGRDDDEPTSGDGSEATGGGTSMGESPSMDPETCSDLRFASFTACLELADDTPAQEALDACVTACPSANEGCAAYACTTQCALDTPTSPEVEACHSAYPECVHALVPEEEKACRDTCREQQQSCFETTTCTGEGASTWACLALHDGCIASCKSDLTPSDGWNIVGDDKCSYNEWQASSECESGYTPTDCINECDNSAPDCASYRCTAECYAESFEQRATCTTTWSDCGSRAACQRECYVEEAACITSCSDLNACQDARWACTQAC